MQVQHGSKYAPRQFISEEIKGAMVYPANAEYSRGKESI
jgi:hypothetical protein